MASAIITPSMQHENSKAIMKSMEGEEHLLYTVEDRSQEHSERRTQEETRQISVRDGQVTEDDLNNLFKHYQQMSTDSKEAFVQPIYQRHPFHVGNSTNVMMQRQSQSARNLQIHKSRQNGTSRTLSRSGSACFSQRAVRSSVQTFGKTTQSRLGTFLSKPTSSLAKVMKDDNSVISTDSASEASLETRSITSIQSSINHDGQSLQRLKSLFRNKSLGRQSLSSIAPVVVLNGQAPLLENLDFSSPNENLKRKVPKKASGRPTETEVEQMELKLQNIVLKPTGEEMWNRREYFASSVQALRQSRPPPKMPMQQMKANRNLLTKEAKEFVVDLKLQMSHKLNDRSIPPGMLNVRKMDDEAETEVDIDGIHEENVLSVFQWSDASVADGLQRKFLAQNMLFQSAKRENELVYGILSSCQDPIDDETLYEC